MVTSQANGDTIQNSPGTVSKPSITLGNSVDLLKVFFIFFFLFFPEPMKRFLKPGTLLMSPEARFSY